MTGATKSKASEKWLLFFILSWLGAYLVARLGLEAASGTGLRVGLALLPIPFFLGALKQALEAIARGDELVRRVHLEALAIAFPLTVTLLMVLGLFELATGLNRDDWSYRHVWPMVAVFYFFGLWRSWKRYL